MNNVRFDYLDDCPPGTYPFMEVIARYADGEITWDAVLDYARSWTPAARKTLAESGWHEAEDAFPVPGTHDELVAVGLADGVTDEEYSVLDAILGDK